MLGCEIGSQVRMLHPSAHIVRRISTRCFLQGHKRQVMCVAFSPDSTRAAIASQDGTWSVWNIDVRFRQQEDPKRLLQQPQEV